MRGLTLFYTLCAIVVAGIFVYVEIYGAAPKQTTAPAVSATDRATMQRMQALGYHCPGPIFLDRTAVQSDGSKIYRLTCGYGGPYYRVTVRTDGSQSVLPLD